MKVADLAALKDSEIATCASGGYGVVKRAQMIALIRRLAALPGSSEADTGPKAVA